jgi:peptidase M28-like protein
MLVLTCTLFVAACGGDGNAAPARAPATATPTAAASAGATASTPVDRFDAPAAFALIRRQVSYGQRPAGSPQLRRLARELRRRMPRGRFEDIPGEPKLRNIVSVVPGSRPALVVGAHYDTLVKPEGFVGANNGAAGSAIVVQLAREVARARRPAGAPEIRFVLFDGEEPAEGLPEEQADFYSSGLRGSRAYAKRHGTKIGAMVLLDYVANKGLRLPREASSTPALWAQIRRAARAAGAIRQFPTGDGPGIIDDHTPFLRAGIPAVDLIDWNYPGHSLEDGMDKLSVRSTDAVGETIRRFVDTWRP